jgi:hypothetical protein
LVGDSGASAAGASPPSLSNLSSETCSEVDSVSDSASASAAAAAAAAAATAAARRPERLVGRGRPPLTLLSPPGLTLRCEDRSSSKQTRYSQRALAATYNGMGLQQTRQQRTSEPHTIAAM